MIEALKGKELREASDGPVRCACMVSLETDGSLKKDGKRSTPDVW